MISPYLLRPVRNLDEALSERAKQSTAGASAPPTGSGEAGKDGPDSVKSAVPHPSLILGRI